MDFTTKTKLFEVLDNIRAAFPDYADALGAEYTDETMLIRKAGASETLEAQPITRNAATGKDEGIIIGDITTLSVDSYNEVVLPEGMDKTRYVKNNVVLRAHNYTDFLPHAENAWLKAYPTNAPTRIRAATKYYLDDEYGLKVYNHRSAKRPLGYSIGFIPIKMACADSEDWDAQVEMWQDRYSKHTGGSIARADMPTPDLIYQNWKLLEYSDVVVPANPDTVASYVAKGLIPPEKAADYTIEGDTRPKTSIIVTKALRHSVTGDYKPDGLWNKSLDDTFDISEFDEASLDFDNEIYTKFLKCKVKNIYVAQYDIPSPLIGTYLSSIQAITEDMTIVDTRRFSYDGTESPPRRSQIQLNSTQSGRFLTDGTEFTHTKHGIPVIKDFAPSWRGIALSLIVNEENESVADGIMNEIHQHADSNHMLRGEKFALSGEFLSSTDDTWDDLVIGAKDKQAIQKSLKITEEDGKSRGLLFVGPPGTGKTKTGRTIMNDTESTFIWMSARDFMYGWPSSVLRLAFDMGRKLAPTVLFMEDIDTDLDVDLVKTELDGLRQNSGLMTILTTNFPERLPQALIDRPGRFHHVLHFALPDKTQRKEMLNKWTDGISESLLKKIVEKTEGFSGAHIAHLVEYADTIAEDEGMEIGLALLESMERMSDQRDLIEELQSDAKAKALDDISLMVADAMNPKTKDISADIAEAMNNVPGIKDITIPERTAFKDFSISSVIAAAQGALE